MGLKHCYFVVNPGEKPPEEFFKAVLAKYPGAVSCVFVKKGKEPGEETLQVYPAIAKATVEDCLSILDDEERIEDTNFIFWACDQTPNEGDVQPFSILEDGEGNKHIVAFADGDFSSYLKTDSTLSPEVFAVSEYLAPKVVALQETSDSLDAAIEQLNTPLIKKEIETMLFGGTRGCATVFASTNKCETFVNKNTTGINTDWGYSSDHCGYGQQAEQPKKNKFQASKAPVAANTNVAATGPKIAGERMVKVKPSSLVQGNTNALKFYSEVLGIPEADVKTTVPNYLFRTEIVEVPESRLADIRKTAIGKNFLVVADTKTEAETSIATIPVVPAVDKSNKAAPASTKGAPLSIPVMDNATKEEVIAWHNKTFPKAVLDASSGKILSLEDIKSLGSKYADWFRQLSMEDKREAQYVWTYPQFEELGMLKPKSLAILAFNHACRAAIAEDKIKQLEAKYEPKVEEKPSEVVTGNTDTGVRKNKFTASKLKTG